MLTIAVGRKYLNGKKDIVTIIGTVEPTDPNYALGHRFVDQYGIGYTENGLFNKNMPGHAFNLVGEMPDTVSTVAAAVEQPGFFTHLGNKMRDNPFKTALALTVAAGAGYVTYESSTTGDANNDVGDTALATAAFLSSWK